MNNDRPPACKTGNAVTINCESTLPRLSLVTLAGIAGPIAILLRQVLAPFESINSGVLTKSIILMLTVL